jgi:hypothetical protein
VAEEEWLEKGKEREIPEKRKERVAEGGVCSLRQAMQQLLERE